MLNNQAFIENLKTSISIIDVVQMLGGLGLEGSLQGNCPTGHESKGGKCFSIVPKGNYFYCFHCGKGGDIIHLVELILNKDFIEAVQWLNETLYLPPKIRPRVKVDFEV